MSRDREFPTTKAESSLDAVLDVALDLEPAKVAAYLDRACANDPELRARVESVLEADRAATPAFLRSEDVAELASSALAESDLLRGLESDSLDRALGASPGDQIGGWRVLREVGRGGMGRVYLAERTDESYEQKAALKLLHAGIRSDEVVSRFLTERRILARLEHPGIARLIDGGLTGEGMPWFAMEFVEGQSITQWCAARELEAAARVRLFLRVSEAVRYAHQNLVIHRDIKPSNIFVTAAGDVKLLDFGIARLLDQEDGAGQTMTSAGPRPMTPRYAAPEQIRGQASTTAVDVYGLGAVLYELLSGRPPFPDTGVSLSELQRAVLEDDPVAPITVAAEQGRAIDRDLGNIALTALAKRPEDRYASVEALIADLERWLHGQPVRATSPTLRYRASKLIQRNRAVAAFVAIALVALVVGLVATRWQLLAAGAVMGALIGGLLISQAQTRRARAAARRAEEIKHFLLRTFEAADPMRTGGRPITVRELVERGAREIEGELADQPELRVEMYGVLGEIYVQLAMAEPGLALVEREIGLLTSLPRVPSARLGDAMRRRGNLRMQAGRWIEAEADLQRAAELHRRDHGPRHPEYAEDLDQLAAVLRAQSRTQEAEAAVREGLEIRRAVLGETNAKVAVSYNNLALMMREAGRPIEAEALYRRALEIRAAVLPPDDPQHFLTGMNLAVAIRQLGRPDEANTLLTTLLARYADTFGDDHDLVMTARNTQAGVLIDFERFEEARVAFTKILGTWEARFGRDHPHAIMSITNLAQALRGLGRLDEAETLAREAVDRWHARHGTKHPAYAHLVSSLAMVLVAEGRWQEAVPLTDEALDLCRASRGDQHPDTAVLHLRRAELARLLGSPAIEKEHLHAAIAAMRQAFPASHPKLLEATRRAEELRSILA